MTPAVTKKLFSENRAKIRRPRRRLHPHHFTRATASADGAKVAILELVGYESRKKEKKEKEKTKKEEPVEAAS